MDDDRNPPMIMGAMTSDADRVLDYVHRRYRRRRRAQQGAFAAAVVLVLSGAVAATLGNMQSNDRVRVQSPGATTNTTETDSVAAISRQLDAYVATEQAKEAAAGKASPENLWGPVISEHSPPVRVGDTYFAVVAYSFDPAGHPVQVLAHAKGNWSRVAALPAPKASGTVSHPQALLLFSEHKPIAVADLTGDGLPDFLISLGGSGCSGGAFVSQAGSSAGWRYVSFAGPFPTGEVLGGNPRFVGRDLISDNNCSAVPTPTAQRRSWSWNYEQSSGRLVGTQHSGWPVNP